MSGIRWGGLLVVSLLVVACGEDSNIALDAQSEQVFVNMLTGEECTPDPATYHDRDRDRLQDGCEADGECNGGGAQGDGAAHGEDDTSGPYGDGTGEGEAQGPGDGEGEGPGDGTCEGECEGEAQGPGDGEGDGTCEGECEGEAQGPGDGEGEGPGDGTCEGECDGEGQGPNAGQGPHGLMCGEHAYHADDFPQPGCDGEGCCQLNAEDAEQVRNREQFRCRCRAHGETDESSLPECCAMERQCQEDPGEEDPGEEDPGEEDPGEEDPGEEDPGEEDPF